MKLFKSASSGQEWLEKEVGSIYSMVTFCLVFKLLFSPFQKIFFQSVN